MKNPGEPIPYRAGELVNQGEIIFTGEDGKLYKMNPLLMIKPMKVKIKARIMPFRNVKAKLKIVKVTRAKKQPKNLSKEAGTFMTEKTKKAREDRQALLQKMGADPSSGMPDIDYGDDDGDEKRKALMRQRPQVIVSGGWDSSMKAKQETKKSKKGNTNEEV